MICGLVCSLLCMGGLVLPNGRAVADPAKVDVVIAKVIVN